MEWDPGFEKTKSFLREVIWPLGSAWHSTCNL
jgi:hypothetical protein